MISAIVDLKELLKKHLKLRDFLPSRSTIHPKSYLSNSPIIRIFSLEVDEKTNLEKLFYARFYWKRRKKSVEQSG